MQKIEFLKIFNEVSGKKLSFLVFMEIEFFPKRTKNPYCKNIVFVDIRPKFHFASAHQNYVQKGMNSTFSHDFYCAFKASFPEQLPD